MPYFVETFDKPGHQDLRQSTRPRHLEFLERNKHLLLACGAKLDEDGETATGGVYLLDVGTRAEAEEFIARDPFSEVELFEQVRISRWRKAYLDGRSFV